MAIERIIYESRKIEHENDSRIITTAFNGDLQGFKVEQVKFIDAKTEANDLGDHYHKYDELYYCREGYGIFRLEDVHNKIRRDIKLDPTERLLIPAYVAHQVSISEDCILVGMTAEPFISKEFNNIPYEIKTF